MPLRQLHVASLKCHFDELIDRHAEAYLAAYPEVKEFSRFEKSGTINYYIGMVWASEYERIDTSQVRVRGSLSLANNRMVELDLSSVEQLFSFFPGQIVAFSADPFIKQRQLTVRKFLDPMKIAPKMKKLNTDDKINLMIASGPYMDVEHEDWTLLEKLIESIKSNQVTHCILIGPFIDSENKVLRANYESSWKLLFGMLMEGLHDHECKVYLVPNMTRDILHAKLGSNYFYPTSGFAIDVHLRDGVIPKCLIKSVDDPSQIDLGGVYVDVTSAEVLFHLHKCSSFINRGPSNMFNSLFRHTITQGIYPIYPPPPTEIAIDYLSLSPNTRLDRLGPHLIVLPTKFTTSITNVENRLVVTIHKCSVKKQVVLIEIPKIESSEERPVESLFEVDVKHKILTLAETLEVAVKAEVKEEMALPVKDENPGDNQSANGEDKKGTVPMESGGDERELELEQPMDEQDEGRPLPVEGGPEAEGGRGVVAVE